MSSDNLGYAAFASGVLSLLLVCCLGQKPFRVFFSEQCKYMWWSRLFRCWHNEWIYKEIRRNRELRQPHDVSDGVLLRVLYFWNPKSRTLPSLCKAIELRHGGQKIFPIDLISRCADTTDISDEYYVAWKIIHLMTDRCVEEIGLDNFPHVGDTISKLDYKSRNSKV